VAVTLLLHPELEDHGDAKNEHDIDSDDSKGSSEDLVKVAVGKGRELANASTLLRCNEGVEAGAVLNKGRCSGVCVAAAIKLVLVSI
jgi:hypothetical protein